MAKKIVNANVTVVVLVLAGFMVHSLFVKAGNLEPAARPGSTMRTLDEIYNAVDSSSEGDLPLVWGNRMSYLKLYIDDTLIEGESTRTSMDRENKIECGGFVHALTTPRDETGQLTGRRRHSPIRIVKRNDKSTPLLYQALCLNEPVDSAEFRFFRPSPDGSGSEEQYYTVLLENGYVSDIQTDGSGLESVSFVFQDVTWTYEVGGAPYKESWRSEY